MHATILAFVAALGVSVLPQVSAAPSSCRANGKAIYLTTNEKDNAIISFKIGSNGSLLEGTSTATGGAGSNAVDPDGLTLGPDALGSQSAVTIAGNYLFAVNAGSNTVSMFIIDPAHPTKLTMVGEPTDVGGEFPNTVAASTKNNLVCVGSTGAKAGISCASFSCDGIGAMDALRPIELNQTTPPLGPFNTVSHVFFSVDEKTLFTTVKGDPATTNTGFFAAYPVTAGHNKSASVAREGVRSSPKGTTALFGASTIPGANDIFSTDASFGAVVLATDPGTNTATLKGKGVVEGQIATCWVAISPATHTAFVTDFAVNRLIEMSVTDASIQGSIDLSANGDAGLTDLQAAGKFVYALSPGNDTTDAYVTVVDVLAKKQVQHVELKSLGARRSSQGMAVLL